MGNSDFRCYHLRGVSLELFNSVFVSNRFQLQTVLPKSRRLVLKRLYLRSRNVLMPIFLNDKLTEIVSGFRSVNNTVQAY